MELLYYLHENSERIEYCEAASEFRLAHGPSGANCDMPIGCSGWVLGDLYCGSSKRSWTIAQNFDERLFMSLRFLSFSPRLY